MTTSSKVQNVLILLPLVLITFLLLFHSRSERSDPQSKKAIRSMSSNSFQSDNHRRIYAKPALDLRYKSQTLSETSAFDVVKNQNSGVLPASLHASSSVELSYDSDWIENFLSSPADRFLLPVESDQWVEATVTKTLTRGPNTHTLHGNLEGDPLSLFTLVFHNGAVSGTVISYSKEEHFQFAMSGDDHVVSQKLDLSTFTAKCGLKSETSADELSITPTETELAPPLANRLGRVEGSAGTLIETVVGYGMQARLAEGSHAAIEARIIASIDNTNLAFANSGVDDVEVVLLGTIEDPLYQFPGVRDGSMGTNDELGQLRNPVDGSLDAVSDLAFELGADQTTFVVANEDGAAGTAFLIGYESVISRTYMSLSQLVFAHELGHNIGCRHALNDGPNDTSLSRTEYGWRFETPNLGRQRTIMAYNNFWPRIPHFSNPSVLVDGVPTGAVAGYDASGDSSVESSLVQGGYDGSQPGLGADNASYINTNASFLSSVSSRPAPILQVEMLDGSPIANIFGTVDLVSTSTTETVSATVLIRNISTGTVSGLESSWQKNHSGHFSISELESTTLSSNESTTATVSFVPSDAVSEHAVLRFSTNDSLQPTALINICGIYDPPLPELEVRDSFGNIVTAGSGRLTLNADSADTPVSDSLTLTNTGLLDLTGLTASLTDNETSSFAIGSLESNSLAPGESIILGVTFTPAENGLKVATLQIDSNDPDSPTFRINVLGNLNGPIEQESFETSLGSWINTSAVGWSWNTGPTTTGLTGPSGTSDEHPAGDYYLYTEGNNRNTTFDLEQTFNFTGYNSLSLEFLYHMYGSTAQGGRFFGINYLQVDAKTSTGDFATVWRRDGLQHMDSDDPWLEASLDLNDYAGQSSVTLRFQGRTGALSNGDMAIDLITITGERESYTLSYLSNDGGTINGLTPQTVISGETSVAVTATADEGYSFLRWSDGRLENPRMENALNSDLSVTAIFLPDTYRQFTHYALGEITDGSSNDPLAEPLGDKVTNLFRYAFNMAFTSAGSVTMEPEGNSGLPLIEFDTTTRQFQVTFVRRRQALDLSYLVEYSDDLKSDTWEATTDTLSVTPIDDEWERVITTYSTNSEVRHFARVKVILLNN